MRHLDKASVSAATSVLSAIAFIACMALISLTVWALLGLLLQV
jgi:hypothetical protein